VYPLETAGAIMSRQVTALPQGLSAGEAIQGLQREAQTSEPMFYAYVVDAESRLVGVLSMRDLILSPEDLPLGRIMRHEVQSVRDTDDQERVAELVARYDYLALPVVDATRKLVGMVTADSVVGVVADEATEDIQKMFGAGAHERLASGLAFSFSRRLPWLLVNLVLSLLGASVVAAFEGTVAALAILAVYMPVIAGMGGNSSAQAMAVAIRGIAVGEAVGLRLRSLLLREARVGLLAGGLTGLMAASVAWMMHLEHGTALGLIIGTAMTINLTLGCLWGAAIPFAMHRLGFDPAQSATIFTTAITDMIGFLLLLAMASIWLT
jgi:magnesium transporter